MEKELRKAYAYRLKPNHEQISILLGYSHAYRFIFNWGLAIIKGIMDAPKIEGEPKIKIPSYFDLCKKMTIYKKEPDMAWLYGVPAHVLQAALKDLDNAMKHFFRRIKAKTGEKPGFPRFKNKYRDDAMRFPDPIKPLHIRPSHVFLPRTGWLEFINSRPMEGDIKQTTIKREGDKWYIYFSIMVKKFVPQASEDKQVIIDFADLAIDGSHFYREEMPRLANIQQSLARKVKGSVNSQKCKDRISRIHRKISNKRKDLLHKWSTNYVIQNDVINIKKLDIKEMMKDPELALALADIGWHNFVNMLKYKCEWHGKHFREI